MGVERVDYSSDEDYHHAKQCEAEEAEAMAEEAEYEEAMYEEECRERQQKIEDDLMLELELDGDQN